MVDDAAACIYVLAGTNGAGKSSVGGAMFRSAGADYFDPDEAAGRIREANPPVTQSEANAAAWQEGRRLLERAISERRQFAFETTLGGRTMTALLQKALARGIDVRIWFVGLTNMELHVARVRSRVEKGGHDIPEARIRERYGAALVNLIALLPMVTELRVFDNGIEADPSQGKRPRPRLVLHLERGRILNPRDLPRTPDWAKPVVAAAMKLAEASNVRRG